MSPTFLGTCQFSTASNFSGSVTIPFSLIVCPRYLTSFCKKFHFLGFILRLAVLSLPNTSSKLDRCSSKVFDNTIISSKYTIHIFQDGFESIFSISLWNVAPALQSPNGITTKFQWPPPGTENAVFSLSSGLTLTCQYPLLRSIAE